MSNPLFMRFLKGNVQRQMKTVSFAVKDSPSIMYDVAEKKILSERCFHFVRSAAIDGHENHRLCNGASQSSHIGD